LSADNIGIVSATVGAGWGVVSGVMQMPPAVIAAGAGVVGVVGVAQAAKAKMEALRDRRRAREDDE
jgi:hypothetical protein